MTAHVEPDLLGDVDGINGRRLMPHDSDFRDGSEWDAWVVRFGYVVCAMPVVLAIRLLWVAIT